MFHPDPGHCPICDAPHAACTADRGPITVTQLPARDAALAASRASAPATAVPPAAPAPAPPSATSFTTATYRGTTPSGEVITDRSKRKARR